MGYGPRPPFDVPNEGEKVSWEGDQGKNEDAAGFTNSVSGQMTKWSERTPQGKPIEDIYQWSEG